MLSLPARCLWPPCPTSSAPAKRPNTTHFAPFPAHGVIGTPPRREPQDREPERDYNRMPAAQTRSGSPVPSNLNPRSTLQPDESPPPTHSRLRILTRISIDDMLAVPAATPTKSNGPGQFAPARATASSGYGKVGAFTTCVGAEATSAAVSGTEVVASDFFCPSLFFLADSFRFMLRDLAISAVPEG